MDEKRLLDSIEKMMDEKVGTLRDEVRGEIAALRQEMTELDEKSQRRDNQTRVLLENNFGEIKLLLQESYSSVAGNAAKGASVAEGHRQLCSTVADHGRALQNHNERITKLEQQVI